MACARNSASRSRASRSSSILLRRPRCAEKWKLLFVATRRAIIEGKAERGAANKMVRLRWRENMVLRAMEREDFALADPLLNSIAGEVGKRKPGASEERPITAEDRARVLAALLPQAEAEQAHASANRDEAPSGDAADRGADRGDGDPSFGGGDAVVAAISPTEAGPADLRRLRYAPRAAQRAGRIVDPGGGDTPADRRDVPTAEAARAARLVHAY